MLHLNIKTRKLTADSGYIHSLDDEIYTDYPIYIAKSQTEADYEEGSNKGYTAWVKAKEEEMEKERETA